MWFGVLAIVAATAVGIFVSTDRGAIGGWVLGAVFVGPSTAVFWDATVSQPRHLILSVVMSATFALIFGMIGFVLGHRDHSIQSRLVVGVVLFGITALALIYSPLSLVETVPLLLVGLSVLLIGFRQLS